MSKEQELIHKIVINSSNPNYSIEDAESWLKDYAKEAKKELIWQMIESWQDAREKGENINEPKFSFNDIEVELYDELIKIDPKTSPPTTLKSIV